MKSISICLFIFVLFSSCTTNINNKKASIDNTAVALSGQKTNPDSLYSRMLKSYADTTHSSIQFRARHSGVYDVIGWIPSFSINMEGQRKDFTDVTVEAKADLRTVVMPNMGMAGNLQGMFDTESYPYAYFKSKSIENIKGNTFQLIGDMTIKEVTKEIALEIQFNGFGHPLNFGVPGFTVDGKFSRFDFGIGEPDVSDFSEGHPLIGDTIYFKSNLRFFFDV